MKTFLSKLWTLHNISYLYFLYLTARIRNDTRVALRDELKGLTKTAQKRKELNHFPDIHPYTNLASPSSIILDDLKSARRSARDRQINQSMRWGPIINSTTSTTALTTITDYYWPDWYLCRIRYNSARQVTVTSVAVIRANRWRYNAYNIIDWFSLNPIMFIHYIHTYLINYKLINF